MKNFQYLSIILVLITCINIVACGNDDEDNNNTIPSELIGSWIRDDNHAGFTFKEGNIGIEWEKVPSDSWSISYTIKDKILTISDNENGEKEKYNIKKLSSQTLILVYENEEYVYSKKSDNNEGEVNQIVGRWLPETKSTILTFYANGTGLFDDKYPFNYILKGTNLTIISNGTNISCTAQINNKTMIITIDGETIKYYNFKA